MSTDLMQSLRSDLLGYDDLCRYVDSTVMYDKAAASRLWNTLTAYLPLDTPEYFVVKNELGNWLSYEDYAKWSASFQRYRLRRDSLVKERKKWMLARRLVVHFEEQAATWTVRDIYEYGRALRALMTDWLNYVGRVSDNQS